MFRNNFQHKHKMSFTNTLFWYWWIQGHTAFDRSQAVLLALSGFSLKISAKLPDITSWRMMWRLEWKKVSSDWARVWLKEAAADCLRSRVSKDHQTKKYLTLDDQWPPCLGGRQGQGWSVLVMQYKRGEDKYVEHWQNWHKIQKGWGCNSECCGLDGMFVQWPMHWPFVISEAVRRQQKRMILSTSKLSFAGACDDHSFGQALSLDHSAFG